MLIVFQKPDATFTTLITLLLLFIKEMNNFIQKRCIKLINSDSKDIYGVTEES